MEVVAGELLAMVAMVPAIVPSMAAALAAADALGLPVGRVGVTVVLL